ncbi:hypothetical protein QBC44DRAFT_322834 [Cladorrhinum sp. PSN332]|nr:hypothetical protein QBC44DRAFT_322834 [Cladorrhinum sp. PSN332]
MWYLFAAFLLIVSVHPGARLGFTRLFVALSGKMRASLSESGKAEYVDVVKCCRGKNWHVVSIIELKDGHGRSLPKKTQRRKGAKDMKSYDVAFCKC